jgi:hypothetical protein
LLRRLQRFERVLIGNSRHRGPMSSARERRCGPHGYVDGKFDSQGRGAIGVARTDEATA